MFPEVNSEDFSADNRDLIRIPRTAAGTHIGPPGGSRTSTKTLKAARCTQGLNTSSGLKAAKLVGKVLEIGTRNPRQHGGRDAAERMMHVCGGIKCCSCNAVVVADGSVSARIRDLPRVRRVQASDVLQISGKCSCV